MFTMRIESVLARMFETDSRKRQSKRDESIRRKIEHDLNKKRKNVNSNFNKKKGKPGTVLSLKPSMPILCKKTSTVFEVSQIMTAKRENCILVVDDETTGGDLLGIFTAKDLAFRIVGSGLNANNLTIDQIMTPNPLCVDSLTPASDALTLMVEKGFRHLPILDNETNEVIGVLDITKCYSQQMEKLEKLHQSSKKLYEALDSVNSQLGGGNNQPYQVFKYFEDLKEKMNGPTLESVLDEMTTPVYCSIKTSVYEATILMKTNKTTAVLVKDLDDKVNGIFTSKDVVLRVIANGLNPKNCSIIRVMTPRPDFAMKNLSIQEALRKMFDGHYLNLPVTDEDNQIIGIVDVLKLTYATLNQIKQIDGNSVEDKKQNPEGEMINSPGSSKDTALHEGPAWNKFWTSLNDTDSLHSDTVNSQDHHSSSAAPEVTPSEFQSFNVDIKPSDSISAAGIGGVGNAGLAAQSMGVTDSKIDSSSLQSPSQFIFKFKSPAIENRVHRVLVSSVDGVDKLRSLIDEKLHVKDFESLGVAVIDTNNESEIEGDKYAISYVDDEGDIVSITSDNDLIDCIKIYNNKGLQKADLYLHNPHKSIALEEIKRNKSTIVDGISNEFLLGGMLMVIGVGTAIALAFKDKR